MRRRHDWEKIVEGWPGSGLTVSKYCDQLQIPKTSFYEHRKKQLATKGVVRKKKEVDLAKTSTPRMVEITQSVTSSSPEIQPTIRITMSGKTLEVYL